MLDLLHDESLTGNRLWVWPIIAAIKLDQSGRKSSDHLREAEAEEAGCSVRASSCNGELLGLLLSTAGCGHAYNPETDARIDLNGSSVSIYM